MRLQADLFRSGALGLRSQLAVLTDVPGGSYAAPPCVRPRIHSLPFRFLLRHSRALLVIPRSLSFPRPRHSREGGNPYCTSVLTAPPSLVLPLRPLSFLRSPSLPRPSRYSSLLIIPAKAEIHTVPPSLQLHLHWYSPSAPCHSCALRHFREGGNPYCTSVRTASPSFVIPCAPRRFCVSRHSREGWN